MNKIVWYLGFVMLMLLPACQNNVSTSVFTPVRPDPTATPSREPILKQPPTPTSVISSLVVTNVFTHTSQRFSIDHPANWELFEQNNGVVLIEPAGQAGYSVYFNDVGETLSQQQLHEYMVRFVADNFVSQDSHYAPISQESVTDSSVKGQFATVDPKLGQMINEVRVSQVDSVVYILLLSATETQWQVSEDKLQTLTDSLTPLDTSPAEAETLPTEEAPQWLLIGPNSNRFAFFYPDNWEILQQTENSVLVAMPDPAMTFEAGVLDWPNTEEPQAALNAAEAYLTKLSNQYKEMRQIPPAEFPLDTITNGVTIDFLYTNADGVTMAGSIITAGSEGNMYRVVFSAPADFYEAALQWFNPMYKSFTILSPEELAPDQE